MATAAGRRRRGSVGPNSVNRNVRPRLGRSPTPIENAVTSPPTEETIPDTPDAAEEDEDVKSAGEHVDETSESVESGSESGEKGLDSGTATAGEVGPLAAAKGSEPVQESDSVKEPEGEIPHERVAYTPAEDSEEAEPLDVRDISEDVINRVRRMRDFTSDDTATYYINRLPMDLTYGRRGKINLTNFLADSDNERVTVMVVGRLADQQFFLEDGQPAPRPYVGIVPLHSAENAAASRIINEYSKPVKHEPATLRNRIYAGCFQVPFGSKTGIAEPFTEIFYATQSTKTKEQGAVLYPLDKLKDDDLLLLHLAVRKMGSPTSPNTTPLKSGRTPVKTPGKPEDDIEYTASFLLRTIYVLQPSAHEPKPKKKQVEFPF